MYTISSEQIDSYDCRSVDVKIADDSDYYHEPNMCLDVYQGYHFQK